MGKTLLRVGEAADFLSVSRWTIYRWLEQGRLEGTKIGRGSLRIFRASLEKLVQENCTDGWRSPAEHRPSSRLIADLWTRESLSARTPTP